MDDFKFIKIVTIVKGDLSTQRKERDMQLFLTSLLAVYTGKSFEKKALLVRLVETS